jgi:hypothetical protein
MVFEEGTVPQCRLGYGPAHDTGGIEELIGMKFKKVMEI